MFLHYFPVIRAFPTFRKLDPCSFFKSLYVLSDLHLYQRYPQLNVTEGEELKLSCIVFAYPEATFSQWTMPGRYGNKEFPQSGDSLIIPKVTYKHAGSYVCSAHNSVHQKKASSNVLVKCNYSLLILFSKRLTYFA